MVARIRNELDDAHADLLGVMVNAVRASAGGYMRKNIRATFDYQSEVPDPADSDTADKAAPPSGGEPKAA
jgi:hypothetical protein